MANPARIHKQFKVLTLVGDVDPVCDFVQSRAELTQV